MPFTFRRSSRRVLATAVVAFGVGLALASAVVARPSGRISNGADVTPERQTSMWPFLVSLGSPGQSVEDGHMCGGELLTPSLVLTAAHCVEDLDEDEDLVRSIPGGRTAFVGSPQLSNTAAGQRRVVRDIFVHPGWNTTNTRHDIAILRLAKPVVLNERVKTISVVSPAEDGLWGGGAGKPASPETGPWVAGWGNTVAWKGEAYPDIAREVNIPIHADSACAAKANPGLGGFEGGYDAKLFICAGVPDSDSNPANGSTALDSCGGDSGGPLVVSDGVGEWRLAAIVSFGAACGASNYTAYTRLAGYRAWINSVKSEPGTGPGGVKPMKPVRTLARTKSTIMLGWAGVAGAKSYVVYAEIGGGGMMRMTASKTPKVVLRGLDSDSEYTLWIGARNARNDEGPLRKVKAYTS